jgi:signal transduction histidine kinase
VPVTAGRQGPGSASLPWIAAFTLGACAVLAFAVPVILGVGGRWSAAAGAVLAAALLVTLALLRRQYGATGTNVTGSELRAEEWQRYAEELERRIDARQTRDSGTESALAEAVDRLINVQLPAALNGTRTPGAFPNHGAAGRTEVAALCDRVADAVAEGASGLREQLDGQIESYRLAVVTLARRVQASAHRIQEQATRMANRHPGDSDVLESSMLVDHAAAQQARHAQSLAVLGGEWPGQQWPQPLALLDVVRAAAGRIVAYRRVAVSGEPDVAATASAVEPLIHLIAELLANATQSSPPTTQVLVTVRTVQRGAVIEIDDGGVGLEEHHLEQAREIVSGRRLLGLGDLGEVPQTGMAVVGQYVRRHGFGVDLMPSPYGGVRAIVLVHAQMVENLEPVAAPALPQLPAPARKPEAVGARPGSLPQRHSRRDESERGGHGDLSSGEATPPAQTPEQAGAWLAAYLSPQVSEHVEAGTASVMPPLATDEGMAPDIGVAPATPRSWDSLGDRTDGPGNEQA